MNANDLDGWRCPPESKMSAARWVANQPEQPVEEFRQKARELFAWHNSVTALSSGVTPDVAWWLRALGFRVRWRYSTKSVFALLTDPNPLLPIEEHYEHWLSDDGITSATVSLVDDSATFVGFETRFVEGMLIHAAPKPSLPGGEQHGLTEDPVADYVSHRLRVRERVEAGEMALSIADPADREAFWNYFADNLSEAEIAEQMNMAERTPSPKPISTRTSGINESGMFLWLLAADFILLLVVVLVGALVLMWGSIDAYLAWLAVWWPILVIVAIPHTLGLWMVLVFRGHLNHLDKKYPDAFDEHAGHWIKERIAALGLAEEIEVGKAREPLHKGLDAYLPLQNKIVLGHKTYDKQDPTFWAIAAHELGHALDFRARPLMRPLSLGSRIATRNLLSWANIVLLGNIFIGWAFASEVWWFLLIGALVTGAVVLVDEAIASRIGLRILGEDERITDAMMVDMKRHLGLAFGTYLAPNLAIIGILLGSAWISGYLETHASFEPAEPLHPGRTALGNALSVVVLVAMLVSERTRFARWWRRLRGQEEPIPPEKTQACPDCGKHFPADVEKCPDHDALVAEVSSNRTLALGWIAFLLGLAAATAFFIEVWDQPLGPWYRAAVFAYVPIVIVFLLPAMMPVTILVNLPLMLTTRFMPEEPTETPVARARAAAADIVTHVKVVDPRQRSPWYLDVAPGPLHFASPLLVLWWASQL